MRQTLRPAGLGFLTLLFVVSSLVTAHAQSPCAHAEFRLDTDLSVDTAAICRAAEPWAEEGMQVFIYLTDDRPRNEEQWYELLDRVEADAGLRNLNLPDSFDRNVVAFENSTAPELNWASTITYGEALYGSPLDTDDATVLAIKKSMRDAIADGDPTRANVDALNATYEINHPVTVATQTETSAAASPKSQRTSTIPWIAVMLAAFGLAAAGVIGYGVYVRVIRPNRERARHRVKLQHHLDELQDQTANLLNACDQLLRGNAVEDTILYQLFSAYGGDYYDALQVEVREWLRRSQSALSSAFALRKQLLDPVVLEEQSLEQTVRAWETLYVTIVGSSERIISLSDAELHALLDPLLSNQRSAPDAQLERQLEDLRTELAGGPPLKVELILSDPGQTDVEGILGYIDKAKTEIARLSEAQHQAPERLSLARQQLVRAEDIVAESSVMEKDGLLAAVNEILNEGDAALQKGAALDAVELAAEAMQGIETISRFINTIGYHEAREAEIAAIGSRGFRPEEMQEDLAEVRTDLEAVVRSLVAGDFAEAATWVTELDTDSQRALSRAETWATLHEQNDRNLAQLAITLSHLTGHYSSRAKPAWEKLGSYPKGNWLDIADDLGEAEKSLKRASDDLQPTIEEYNSMDVQRFDDAEQLLAQATAELAFAEGQFEGIVNRLTEVQTAETHIREALQISKNKLDEAITLRDREDPKIGVQVDVDLEQARVNLADAERLAADREFIASTLAQTTARELASASLAAASQQVSEINALQITLAEVGDDAQDDVDHCSALARALPEVTQTSQTNELVRQVKTALSAAHQLRAASIDLEDHALADALRTAIAAYEEVTKSSAVAQKQITADRVSYDQALTETRHAVHDAEKAIQKARWAVEEPDARNEGWHALKRAENTLAQLGPLDSATREALVRLRQSAQQAEEDAQRAESQARRTLENVQAERRRRLARVGGSVMQVPVPAPARRGRRTSPRQTSRVTSRQKSPWRSTSTRGTSRRTVSSGSSRRK